jgi:hypothetical protein
VIDLVIDLPDETHLIARFGELPKSLLHQLVPTITRETQRLYGMVLAAEPMRTGQLRSATQMFVDVGEDFIRGRVRILGPSGFHAKAGSLEYGAHSVARVTAHQMMLGHLWGEIVESRQVMIEAYQRQVNISELRFMRAQIERIRTEAEAEIEKTINAEISRAHVV